MDRGASLVFGRFRLDTTHGTLWSGDREIELQPRPLAVLRYLAENPGRVVSKEELLAAVWAGTFVSKTTLKVCVRTVREALGESAAAPRLIETVGRDGYRFIGPIGGLSAPQMGPLPGAPEARGAIPPVGRESELRQLRRWLGAALQGKRQVVFVAGEAGIGKTTLVDEFLLTSQAPDAIRIGRGQCLEQYGEGEAYLPVLEAIGRLCREPGGAPIVGALRRYAPSWLAHLPALAVDHDAEAPPDAIASGERMLREMAEALEAMTAEHALVLVLEDLHWSDVSTLELVAYLAERRGPARLLVIGTYRPTHAIVREHPLRGIQQELLARGCAAELTLELLTADEVAEYVTARLGPGPLATDLARVLHGRSHGNPLFMVELLRHVSSEGQLVNEAGQWHLKLGIDEIEAAVPDTLRRLIGRQLERLRPEQQRLLEAASVAGAEFTVAALAAGIKRDAEEVEEECEELAWAGFLREGGIVEWPDGTLSGGYRFRHALYQNVLHDRVPAARRVRLHRAIGECEETAHGTRVDEIAAELALHFGEGREYERAVRYHLQAGDSAARRDAHREAIGHFTKSLELLAKLPATQERRQQEVLLQFRLGLSLLATKGFAAPEVEATFLRIGDLSRALGDTGEVFITLPALRGFHFVRGEIVKAQELSNRLLNVAERLQDRLFLQWAYFGVGEDLLWCGAFREAREHLERAAGYVVSRQIFRSGAFRGSHDPAATARSQAALALWHLGYPDQALERAREALARAREAANPATLAFVLTHAAWLRQARREAERAGELAGEARELSEEYGFQYWTAHATAAQGWAVAMQGDDAAGVKLVQAGMAAAEATGAAILRSFFLLLLVEAHAKAGRLEAGLAAITEALDIVEASGVRRWEGELYRLRGVLLMSQPATSAGSQFGSAQERRREAERWVLRAVDVSGRQAARSLELRALTSLCRLRQRRGSRAQAREMLAKVHGGFQEGFDTADLQEAQEQLAGL
jgi:DNA-binding winged helix-turn-helix (wHTH) protein/tetratricopeptide (TPR) repeat protein